MKISSIDIENFGRLRKRLEPILKDEDISILIKIESAFGVGFLPAPQVSSNKKQTQKDRIAKYLMPKGHK